MTKIKAKNANKNSDLFCNQSSIWSKCGQECNCDESKLLLGYRYIAFSKAAVMDQRETSCWAVCVSLSVTLAIQV